MGLRPSLFIAFAVVSTACGREGSLLALYDVAEIVCGRDGSTELLDREVNASADGVHIRVRNEADGLVFISGLGIGADEGTTENVSNTSPGVAEVDCRPHSLKDGPKPTRVHLRINDPHGHWVDHDVSCRQFSGRGSGLTNSIFDGVGGGAPPLGQPPALGRQDFSGLKQDDVVERAGYPKTSAHAYARVVRRDETIASATFFRSGPDWYASTISACIGAGVGVRL